MAQHEAVSCGFTFRENSLHLLENDNGDGLDVELIAKGSVIYIFDSSSKSLLKELITTRNFSVSTGSDLLCIVLRDDTKEIALRADAESVTKTCLDYFKTMIDNLSKHTKESEEPVTVVFRHPQASFTNKSQKPKLQPPPTAPKPKNLTSSMKQRGQEKTQKESKELLPFGTVKALSRDLARVLFNPFSTNSSRNQQQLEKTKVDDAQKRELELDAYESVNGEIENVKKSPTLLHQSSRIPSDPIIEEHVMEEAKEAERAVEEEKNKPNQLQPDIEKLEHTYDNQFYLDNEANESIEESSLDDQDTLRSEMESFGDNDGDMYACNIEIRRPWLLRGHPTRQDAAKAVKGQCDGAFVVRSRDGSSDAHIYPYALTVQYKNQPMHMQIQRTQSAGLVLAPWNAGEKAFETLDDLVQYYRDNRLAFAYHNVQGFISLQKGNFSYD